MEKIYTKMKEGQSHLKICVKIHQINALGQINKKFNARSNFYDPVEKCIKWTKCTTLHRKYAIESVSYC